MLHEEPNTARKDNNMANVIGFTFEHKQKGLEKYLQSLRDFRMAQLLDEYGAKGVSLLTASTPVRTGKTAESWSYEIVQEGNNTILQFKNSNVNNHVNIAYILQMGHGTRNGGYVQGRDYINPPMQQLFDELRTRIDKEVKRL